MLIQCTQCHKEFLAEVGLRGPSGKPYCSQYCLKQAQSSENDPSDSSSPSPAVKQAFPIGQVMLVILALCGGLYLLKAVFSGPDTESTIVQNSQTQQSLSQQEIAQQVQLQSAPPTTESTDPNVQQAPDLSGDTSQTEGNLSQNKSPEQLIQSAEQQMKTDPLAARASLEQVLMSTPSAKAYHLLAQLQMQANEFAQASRSAELCLNQVRTTEEKKLCHELSIQVFQRQVETGIDEGSSAKQRSKTAAQLAKAPQSTQTSTPASALPSLAPQVTDRVKEELKQEQLRHAQELIALAPKEGKGYWHRGSAQCQLAGSPDATAQANASIAEACHLGYAEACKQRCRDGKMGPS